MLTLHVLWSFAQAYLALEGVVLSLPPAVLGDPVLGFRQKKEHQDLDIRMHSLVRSAYFHMEEVLIGTGSAAL